MIEWAKEKQWIFKCRKHKEEFIPRESWNDDDDDDERKYSKEEYLLVKNKAFEVSEGMGLRQISSKGIGK